MCLRPDAAATVSRLHALGITTSLITGDNERVTANNWDGGVQPDSRAPVAKVLPAIRTNSPIPHASLEIQPADKAFETALANAGATWPRREAVDERIVKSVRIGEVTAYGAAWRRGEVWPVGPAPIPINHVTRAAFLWRSGECYRRDASATNVPRVRRSSGSGTLR